MLPEPPDVIIDNGTNTIHVLPYDDNGNPPDYYHFLVSDITGETILSNILAATGSDVSIDDPILYQYSSECAPFLVSVSAVNKYGEVDTNVFINSKDAIGDICICINETGKSTRQSIP